VASFVAYLFATVPNKYISILVERLTFFYSSCLVSCVLCLGFAFLSRHIFISEVRVYLHNDFFRQRMPEIILCQFIASSIFFSLFCFRSSSSRSSFPRLLPPPQLISPISSDVIGSSVVWWYGLLLSK